MPKQYGKKCGSLRFFDAEILSDRRLLGFGFKSFFQVTTFEVCQRCFLSEELASSPGSDAVMLSHLEKA